MSDIIHCKDCKYQIKTWHDDMRFKDNGYFTYWCRLNDDPLSFGKIITIGISVIQRRLLMMFWDIWMMMKSKEFWKRLKICLRKGENIWDLK